ncbi:GNAT family acetyltransferase [Noviherbaspirillum autotrophicum]|uniref:GNAT family acetyltransferase n=2 Tax=Noviherbaspirillum autotrophicum TaxID=709839 RepID=A0A0C2BU81_9BURK|nr:GNAT family acetyltransferase [Noviherbaspirillum autotrophicum]
MVTALALVAPLAQSQVAPSSLHMAVEAAWQRSPQARTLTARRNETAAGREAAQSWIAGSPTIGLSQRSDRWTDRTGVRENEVSLAAPIWLPGQKSARQNQADANALELEAQLANAKLSLAGEVRDRLWSVVAAREALDEAIEHQRHLEATADEVMRRVKAGDLARTDGLLAQQEVFAAKATVMDAQVKAQEALVRYTALTGQPDVETPEPEPLAAAISDPHPRILAARAGIQSAQASLKVVNKTRSEPPTLAVAMRRERDASTATASSVVLAVQIPIGTNARNRPLETAAQTQIASATAEAAQAEVTLNADINVAKEQVAASQQALEAAASRLDMAREHMQLIDKAFRLGERGLVDQLRAQTLLHEAATAERQQRVAVGLAHARLNQALGIIP